MIFFTSRSTNPLIVLQQLKILFLILCSTDNTDERSEYPSGTALRSVSTNHYILDTFPTNSRAQCQLMCAAECLTRDHCTGYNCNNEICTLFSSNCSSADNSTTIFKFRGRGSEEITTGMITIMFYYLYQKKVITL